MSVLGDDNNGVDVQTQINGMPAADPPPPSFIESIVEDNYRAIPDGDGDTSSSSSSTTAANMLIITTPAILITADACTPGLYYHAGACALCPWGFWCANGTITACAPGTANPDAGASTSSACTPCIAGTYVANAGAVTCLDCPPGAYCSGAGNSAATATCPPHTTSAARSTAIGNCFCLDGYQCSYTRSVTLRLALNTTRTLDELRADPAVAYTLSQSVILALGLYGTAAQVTFQGFELPSI